MGSGGDADTDTDTDTGGKGREGRGWAGGPTASPAAAARRRRLCREEGAAEGAPAPLAAPRGPAAAEPRSLPQGHPERGFTFPETCPRRCC